MEDLAQTLWIAFDKKQPDYPKFIDWIQEPLELKYLVAVKDGEVLNPVIQSDNSVSGGITQFPNKLIVVDSKQYLQAMESVLYEGFEISNDTTTPCIVHLDSNQCVYEMVSNHQVFYSLRHDICFMNGHPITLQL